MLLRSSLNLILKRRHNRDRSHRLIPFLAILGFALAMGFSRGAQGADSCSSLLGTSKAHVCIKENSLSSGPQEYVPTLLAKENRQQIQEIALIGIKQPGDRIQKETSPWIRGDLRAYQGLWRIPTSNPERFRRILDGASRKTP